MAARAERSLEIPRSVTNDRSQAAWQWTLAKQGVANSSASVTPQSARSMRLGASPPSSLRNDTLDSRYANHTLTKAVCQSVGASDLDRMDAFTWRRSLWAHV